MLSARIVGAKLNISYWVFKRFKSSVITIHEANLKDYPIEKIRNFCIIAHVDHGKSTLADRFLQAAGNVTDSGESQILDSLKVEKERGITVKAQSVSMVYKDHLLNLIDTPGHVDFSYEVKRSLKSCDGALLLVDSTQGVQAQTIANYRKALKENLEIIPVLTKLDLPNSDPDRVLPAMQKFFNVDASDTIWTSAKSGDGIEDVLDAIIEELPCPSSEDLPSLEQESFFGKIVDSWHHPHKGVAYIVNSQKGVLRVRDPVFVGDQEFNILELAISTPVLRTVEEIYPGQVATVFSGQRNVQNVNIEYISSTRLSSELGADAPKQMIFTSIFPYEARDLVALRKALDKLVLNDQSVSVEPESNVDILGQGFRLGFLGKLHMEVFVQRLKDEFKQEIVSTSPSVPYKLVSIDKGELEQIIVDKVSEFPQNVKSWNKRKWKSLEPTSLVTILVPDEYVGGLIDLIVNEKRGRQELMEYIDNNVVLMHFQVPLEEIVNDLVDRVKGVSSGYASMDYSSEIQYVESDVVKVDVHVAKAKVNGLSFVTHRSKGREYGGRLLQKLKEKLPAEQFEVSLQAVVENKIISSEKIKAVRKDVLTKAGKTVGGGDITRKMKLLEKQKKGKKLLRAKGQVNMPQKLIMNILSNRN
eukprot:snap_masked-scaffold_2-processed-gene-6.7-mRNA-1 protein AED:0.28 eAED:0.28 QI:0/0/0/1/1/1/2/0/642